MANLDPRSVANTIIGVAENFGLPLTHLSLQKIVYFIHGVYLTKKREPLVAGYFEAWQYGPVHPVLYNAFREAGASQLTTRATKKDLGTGAVSVVGEVRDAELRLFIIKESLHFLQMSPGRLVDLSHARGSPWDYLTKSRDGSRSFGVRITSDHILNSFRFHKMSVRDEADVGEPNDESPPS